MTDHKLLSTFNQNLAGPIPDQETKGKLGSRNRSQGSQGGGNSKTGEITANSIWKRVKVSLGCLTCVFHDGTEEARG